MSVTDGKAKAPKKASTKKITQAQEDALKAALRPQPLNTFRCPLSLNPR
jgi:hypothetical protein